MPKEITIKFKISEENYKRLKNLTKHLGNICIEDTIRGGLQLLDYFTSKEPYKKILKPGVYIGRLLDYLDNLKR